MKCLASCAQLETFKKGSGGERDRVITDYYGKMGRFPGLWLWQDNLGALGAKLLAVNLSRDGG